MAARLGNVIYWAGCGIAVLPLLALAAVVISPGQDALFGYVGYPALAALVWLFGGAARYILAGT